ncbi:MAG: hypothetical protein VX730_07865 [Pseudomonadota bacterium]|nr:hypothetical protein [Pseudomonadota bacterium]
MTLFTPLGTLQAMHTYTQAYANVTRQAQEQLVFTPMRQCSALMVNFAPTPPAKLAAALIQQQTENTITLSKAIGQSF